MRETARAKQAFNDYVSLGADRSLENLLKRYQNESNPPTTRLPSLKEWSRHHGWQRRLEEIAEQEKAAIVARGIADKQNRIDALNDRWRRLRAVMEERAEANDDLTGGATGLVVREVTYLPSGGTRERHEVDTGLLKELREHEKQAAIEMGQWAEKRELTSDGEPIRFTITIDRRDDGDGDAT